MAKRQKPEPVPAAKPEAKQRGKPNRKAEKPTTKPEKPAKKPRKQQKQLTTAEWRKIRLEYIRGKTTYKKLAEKWGISEITISHRASLEGWRKKKLNADRNTTEKAIARMCDARAREFEKIAIVNDRMDDILNNLVDFVAAQPPKKYDELRGIESLTKAINTVVMTKRDLYNMPTEEQKAKIEALREKSKLERQKFEEEQAEKAASKAWAENTMIRIVLEGDTEDGETLDE